MMGWMSLANRVARKSHGFYVSALVVLALATLCWSQQPQAGMRRRTAAAPRLKTIQLPEPLTSSNMPIEQALLGQQKLSVPSDQRLDPGLLSQLAWAAQGVRVPRATTTAANGTVATQPTPAMRVYFVLPDGVYLYNPADHSLQQISGDDERQTMALALVRQPGTPIGGAQIVLAGSSRDFAATLGTQARTTMLLQAGQAAASIQLQAVGLGLTFISMDNANLTAVRRVIRLAKNIEPLYVIFIGHPANKIAATAGAQTAAQATVAQPGARRVLFVVPQQAFQDQELFETRRALELAGVSVQVASTRLTTLTGMLGGTTNADILLNQAKLDDYSGVVFIGGAGVTEYFSNRAALNLARLAAERRKVVAAVGTAPTILANAGILKGVRATGYLPEQARIMQGGATYTGNPVEKDSLIITATSAPAVPLFVQAILEGLGQVQ